MAMNTRLTSKNLLISAMSNEDLSLLSPNLSRVRISRAQQLIMPGQPIEHIHFLEGGLASLTSSSSEKGQTEVGVVGREGMTGVPIL